MAALDILANEPFVLIVALQLAIVLVLYGLRPKPHNGDQQRRWVTAPRRAISRAPDQLSAVMAAPFRKRNVISKAELRVLRAAEQAIDELSLSWKVMAQVSLGEILSSPSESAYASINAARRSASHER